MRPKGATEAIQPGDSILSPRSNTFMQAEPAAEQDAFVASDCSNWQMASLSFLLPKEPTSAGNLPGQKSNTDHNRQHNLRRLHWSTKTCILVDNEEAQPLSNEAGNVDHA